VQLSRRFDEHFDPPPFSPENVATNKTFPDLHPHRQPHQEEILDALEILTSKKSTTTSSLKQKKKLKNHKLNHKQQNNLKLS
jgi:hypothetical protein